MMQLKIIARSFVLSATCLSLVACGSVKNVNDTMQSAQDMAGQAGAISASAEKQAKRDTVVFSDDPIVSLTPLHIAKTPRGESMNCPIDLLQAKGAQMDILEFSQYVTRQCGIPVRVTPDALAMLNGQLGNSTGSNATGQSSATANAPTPGQAIPSLPSFSGQSVSTLSNGSSSARNKFSGGSSANMISDIKWDNRPVEGLLDVVTSRLGLSWKRVKGMVSIYYLDTQAFAIYAIPSTTDMSSVVQSGTSTSSGVSGSASGASSGVTGSSGSNQTTTVSNKASLTDDIVRNIKGMLTPGIGRIGDPSKDGELGSSTGTILVTDTPEVLDRVRSYLDAENASITKQVRLNVKVLSVTLTDSENLGINWSAVYNALSGKFGLALSNTFASTTGAISGTISVPTTATGGLSQFAGTSMLIQALSQQGKVATVTSPSVTTLNMQAVPVQVARQTGYLAGVQTTSTASVGSSTALTAGTVTTGFNMNLLPYVLPDDNLLLQYSINLSALDNIRTVTSGGASIEIPEVDDRIFSQKVRLKSGETLVLSGFEQTIDNGSKSGTGTPGNFAFGGGYSSNRQHDVIVVLITPFIME